MADATPANPERKSGFLKNFISGGVGGACVVITGQPFDTVKVRIQTMPHVKAGEIPLYKNPLDCAMVTIRKEGFFALYKGMAAPLAGVTPVFAIFFLGTSIGNRAQQSPGKELKLYQHFLSGGFAGVLTTVIMTPGERIKCLLQVQHAAGGKPKYAGPIDVARQLYKEGGIRSIYKGTVATLSRDIPASGAYIATYEYAMQLFTQGEKERKLSPMKTLAAGALAGIANWLACMPQDVVKSRLQTAPEGKYPHGIRDIVTELWRENGIKAFYKGFTPVMLRAVPANAACFLGLEVSRTVLTRLGL